MPNQLRNRTELENAFKNFIKDWGSDPQRHKQNRLLFYFAGHGETIRAHCQDEMGTGYLVSADAPVPLTEVCPDQPVYATNAPRRELIADRGFSDYAVNLETIRSYALDIRANHALFLFDSCFAGTIFTRTRSDQDSFN